MKTPLQPGEILIKYGPANLQRGAESVGGQLFLTSERLIFESHPVNFQPGTSILALADVWSIQKCWTKFLNVIPLAANSVSISIKNGDDWRIVLWRRSE